jgi:hypothetical protein
MPGRVLAIVRFIEQGLVIMAHKIRNEKKQHFFLPLGTFGDNPLIFSHFWPPKPDQSGMLPIFHRKQKRERH